MSWFKPKPHIHQRVGCSECCKIYIDGMQYGESLAKRLSDEERLEMYKTQAENVNLRHRLDLAEQIFAWVGIQVSLPPVEKK
jgi:hypothetical protein